MSERFAESTNLAHGVVEDTIPEDDVYRHDENPVIVWQFGDDYWLGIGSRVGLDTVIEFDSARWEPGEYSGTLWLTKTVGDTKITTGHIDWHAAYPTRELGLVGEWFVERIIDFDDYRSGVDCPECGGEVLHLPMHSACDSPHCDFFCEGHLDPPEDTRD